MNKYKDHIGRTYIFFKQWSNRSYAIFNSIGKVVHIGFISPIVFGVVTVKSLIIHEILKVIEGEEALTADENELMSHLLEGSNLVLSTGLLHKYLTKQSQKEYCKSAAPTNKSILKTSPRPVSGLFYFVCFLSKDTKSDIFYISNLQVNE